MVVILVCIDNVLGIYCQCCSVISCLYVVFLCVVIIISTQYFGTYVRTDGRTDGQTDVRTEKCKS